MNTLMPTFTVERDNTRREIHLSMGGLFNVDGALEVQKELFLKSQPFIEDGRKFRVLVDLRDMAVQTSEVVEQMRISQDGSAKVGVERMALVCSSVLVKRQFNRVSERLNLGLFDTRAEALGWLRAA